jgi:hypothetical protein
MTAVPITTTLTFVIFIILSFGRQAIMEDMMQGNVVARL